MDHDDQADVPLVVLATPEQDELTLSFITHGVRNGWCTWPLKFDPTWVRTCSGFATPELANEA